MAVRFGKRLAADWAEALVNGYQISMTLKTNPGKTGSPLIVVGFSKHSTALPGRYI
jgi:hypothetical protein